MSSKPEAQNEPTMEEILASIRRIISEDEPAGGKPAEAVPPATPPAAPKAAAKPAPQRAPEPAPEASGRGAENILELTRMVADDGSIVDLADQPAAEEPAAEEPASDEPAGAEPAEEPEAADEPAAEEPAAEEATEEPVTTEEEAAAEEPAEAPAEEALPSEEQPADEEPSGGDLLRPHEEAEAEAEADEPPAEPARVPATAGEGSEFVSAVTAAAATASLAAVTKAAMANRQGDAIAIGGGRTLEELVRQSLAPELKGWLDANLPDLVERIVREEIRKMIRRAEDQ
ncbi:MAG: DUF2497 domain-containing protein [Bacteroidota bacterium]